MEVKYTAEKRPLKLGVYFIDCPESEAYLSTIISFVKSTANAPARIAKMEPPKFWALVERLATMFCMEYAPTREHGITKPEIRGAVYFVLNAGLRAGSWPDEYMTTDKTFVQYSN